MAHIKVQPQAQSSLCYTCRNAHVRRGMNIGNEQVWCRGVSFDAPQRITFPVIECSDYHLANVASLHDMTQIATFISIDKRTGKVGFVAGDKAPDELKDSVHDGDPL